MPGVQWVRDEVTPHRHSRTPQFPRWLRFVFSVGAGLAVLALTRLIGVPPDWVIAYSLGALTAWLLVLVLEAWYRT